MTLLEQYMADYQRVCAEKVALQEQLEALREALRQALELLQAEGYSQEMSYVVADGLALLSSPGRETDLSLREQLATALSRLAEVYEHVENVYPEGVRVDPVFARALELLDRQNWYASSPAKRPS